jgi:hypothetical protein
VYTCPCGNGFTGAVGFGVGTGVCTAFGVTAADPVALAPEPAQAELRNETRSKKRATFQERRCIIELVRDCLDIFLSSLSGTSLQAKSLLIAVRLSISFFSILFYFTSS